MPTIDQETLELAQSLIRVDTVDPPGNELQAASIVAGVLQRAGIASEIVDRLQAARRHARRRAVRQALPRCDE